MSKLTAAVTGGRGFVGSHMIKLLVSRGLHVIAIDIKHCKSISNEENINHIRADITDKTSLDRVFREYSYVFHIAGLFNYSAKWEKLYKANVIGTKNVCNAALNCDLKKMVVWSSGSIYGIPKEIPVKEDAPISPLNDYERSKAEQEKMALQYYRDYGLPITVIRPAAIYGPRSKYGIALIIFMLAKGKIPAIPGPGKYKPALVHVEDVVNATYFLANKSNTVGEVYNVSDDGKYTTEELLIAAAQKLGIKLHSFHIPISVLNAYVRLSKLNAKIRGKKVTITRDLIRYLTYDSIMDNTKLKNEGYKLIYPDTIEGIYQTIEWYKEEGWIWASSWILFC